MTPKEKNKTTDLDDVRSRMETGRSLKTEIEQLQYEVDNLKKQLMPRRLSPNLIGVTLLAPGVLALVFSFVTNSQVLAFIGLGLTFWGALFLLVNPVAYVKGSLLDAAAVSSYSMIDRIIRDLKLHGKSFYIPPYPKELYIPEHLRGLKEMTVFISASATSGPPSVAELASSKFIVKNPDGVCLSPPGLGLLDHFERDLKMDLSRTAIEDICAILPDLLTENLQIAKTVEMKATANNVKLIIVDSFFKNIYRENDLKSVYSLGCPIVSAVACAVAKSTGRIISVESLTVSPDARSVEASYNIMET